MEIVQKVKKIPIEVERCEMHIWGEIREAIRVCDE
jgi:hypothetical protein